MHLTFPGIAPVLRETLEKETAESICPLADQEDVEVIHTADVLLFKCSAGFFFTPHTGISDVETYRDYLKNPQTRRYMPVAYEVEDLRIADKLMAEFVNKYSATACEKILKTTYKEGGKHLLLLQLPHEIVKAIFHKTGGQLLTTYSGSLGALRKIPTLAPSVPEGGEDDLRIRRVFATPYKTGEYDAAMAVHQQVVREVMAAPNSGISLGPLAVWSP
jgi:hypothetical protein